MVLLCSGDPSCGNGSTSRPHNTTINNIFYSKPKYNIGFIFKGGDSNFGNDLKLLALLEPWCSTIYVDTSLLQDYIQTEQPNTIMNLHDRVKPLDNEKVFSLFSHFQFSLFLFSVEGDGNGTQTDLPKFCQYPNFSETYSGVCSLLFTIQMKI